MKKKSLLLQTKNPSELVAPFQSYWRDSVFIIPPYKITIWTIVGLTFVIFILPSSIFWGLFLYNEKCMKMPAYMPHLATAISFLTLCLIFICYFVQSRKPNYFEFDKIRNKIVLPRDGLQIEANKVVCIRSVTEKIRMQNKLTFLSELQVIIADNKKNKNIPKVIFATSRKNTALQALTAISQNTSFSLYVFYAGEDVTHKTIL